MKFDDVGKIIIEKYKIIRAECEYCGEIAIKKNTYLLPNARNNPASSGYGKDDISWCQDKFEFVCDKCNPNRIMDGYRWCSTFPANKNFEHLFVSKQKWEDNNEIPQEAAEDS